jgi:Gas vesicle synthesis protein GvpL/GvpF
MRAMAEETGLWAYAVMRASSPMRPVTGVAGGMVGTVVAGDLAAVTSPVDLAEYGEDALRRNLEQLPWLEAAARAHHGVIAEAAKAGPVVPLRLATVYRTHAGLVGMLVRHTADFQLAFDRIGGRSEWGVKAYAATTDRPGSEATAELRSERGSGAQYLSKRKAQLAASEDSRKVAVASARDVHAMLSSMSVAADLHQPQDPQLSGRRDRMIMNGTYLVDDQASGEFAAAVQDAAAGYPALRLELTGPWPPYSFATAGPGD